MSDETAVQAEAEQQPTDAAPTGAEPGKQTEARTFTQADLDRIVTERLAKERAKADAAVRKAQEDAEAKALKEQGEYKTLYEKMQAELEQERAARRVAEVAGMRRDVAARLQLPVGLVDRLRGETEDEITEDAKALLAALPKPPAPNINAGSAAANGKTAVIDDTELEHLAARLNVLPKYAKQFLNNGG